MWTIERTWTLKPEEICFQKYLYYVLSVPLGQWPLTCQSPQLKNDMITSENSVLTRRWLQHSAPSSPIRVPPAVPEATTATSWLTPRNILGPHPLSSSLDPYHPEFTGIQSFLSLLNRSYMWLKKFHTRGFSSQALDMGCFRSWIPTNHCKSSSFTEPPLRNGSFQPPSRPAPQPPSPSYRPRSNLGVLESESYMLSRGRLQFLISTGLIQFVCILVIPIKYIPNNKCSNFSFIIFAFYSYCSNKIYTQQYGAIFLY